VAIQDGSHRPVREPDIELPEFARDAQVAPDRVLGGEPNDQLLDVLRRPGSPGLHTLHTLHAQSALQHESMPAADGRGLGDGRDLGQPLPPDARCSPGQAISPAVGEVERGAGRQLVAQVDDLGREVGDLGDQGLVLPGQDGGGDQAGEEREAVHVGGGPVSGSVAGGRPIGKERAEPRLIAGVQGLRIVQQMQHVRPQMSTFVPLPKPTPNLDL